jgi:hypothetical protein
MGSSSFRSELGFTTVELSSSLLKATFFLAGTSRSSSTSLSSDCFSSSSEASLYIAGELKKHLIVCSLSFCSISSSLSYWEALQPRGGCEVLPGPA